MSQGHAISKMDLMTGKYVRLLGAWGYNNPLIYFWNDSELQQIWNLLYTVYSHLVKSCTGERSDVGVSSL
jgi:hypothetical protein